MKDAGKRKDPRNVNQSSLTTDKPIKQTTREQLYVHDMINRIGRPKFSRV